jgi:hypothetical protein
MTSGTLTVRHLPVLGAVASYLGSVASQVAMAAALGGADGNRLSG